MPAARVREHYAELAAAARPRVVAQRRAVALGELPRDIESEARAAGLPREERLEDLVHVARPDARAAIGDLEKGPTRGFDVAAAELDRDRAGRRARVLDRVVAQVPDDLMQVRRVHLGLDVDRRARYRDGALVELERLHELAREVLEPGQDLQPLGLRLLAARQREHALDDLTHAPRVHADDVGEPLAVGADPRRFREQLARMAHRADRVADLV